ncbi:FAD-dependent monooxygenase [Streptomyces marincola]|uniref:FAD-dependent monooxygenase n=1 Tax=Streptomyces marincola TaxID=2878388 RepID=UPI001CF0F64A|nr:FAD-dependent monooxygenase [Streptomyces marincola]UCM89379.1 FAD-dependent monooxygenase [Streptomyces marincola]
MRTQVLVVGAGPVGLMLAAELRLGGADTVVVERLPAPLSQSRASTLHARTMELLAQRGLLPAFGAPPHAGTGHFGGLPLDLSRVPSPYAGLWKIPQPRIERVLADRATALGATVLRGRAVTALDTAADRVTAAVDGPTGPSTVTADWVVGCDGEDSTVRRLAGIPFPGTDGTRELLRADLADIDLPARRFERHPRGLAVAGPVAEGVTRVMVHEYGGAPRERGGLAFGEVAATWGRVVGEDISGARPLWVNAFDDTARQAAHYRAGRVLLAGDAAHRQLPVGGQALNLGLHDAVNLGWKLAATARGLAPAGLLDTYHGERHPAGARTLTAIRAQTLLLLGGPRVDGVRALVGELLRLPGPRAHLAAGIAAVEPDPPGRPAHDPGASAAMDAALRAARGLLLDLSGSAARTAALRARCAGWAGRVDVVGTAPRPPGAPGPPPGAATVLVRPDGVTAWRGGRDADPEDALRGWFGAPH